MAMPRSLGGRALTRYRSSISIVPDDASSVGDDAEKRRFPPPEGPTQNSGNSLVTHPDRPPLITMTEPKDFVNHSFKFQLPNSRSP